MGWYRMEHSNEPLGSQGGSCQGVSSEYSTVRNHSKWNMTLSPKSQGVGRGASLW